MSIKKFIVPVVIGTGFDAGGTITIASSSFPGAPFSLCRISLLDGQLETFQSSDLLRIRVSPTPTNTCKPDGSNTPDTFVLEKQDYTNARVFKVGAPKPYTVQTPATGNIVFTVTNANALVLSTGLDGYLVFELEFVK